MPSRTDLWFHATDDGERRYRIAPPLREARGTFDEVFRRVWTRPREDGPGAEGWTIYFDETRLLADKLGMGRHLETVWIAGRSRGITVVAATQAPRDVPSEFYDQARYIAFGNVRDRRALRRFSEIGGDTDMLMETVPRLDWHEWLIVGPRWAVRTKLPAPGGRRG